MKKDEKTPPRRLLHRMVHSIKTQLIVAMLTATLIPLSIVTVLTGRTISQEVLSSELQALQGAAQQTTQRLDAFVEKGLYHGTASAALPELLHYIIDPNATAEKKLRATLKSIQNQNPIFIQHVSLLDPQGHTLISSCEEGMHCDHHPLLDTFISTLETGKSQLSPIHFDEDIVTLSFSSPILKDGEPVGLLRISYSATILQHLISQYTGLLDATSFPVLTNEDDLQIANGTLSYGNSEQLYRLCKDAPSEELLQRMIHEHRLPQNYTHSNPDHLLSAETRLSASTPMKSMPWAVTFFQSEEVLLRPVRQQQKHAFFLGGGLALCTILAALWISKRLTSPIQDLTKTAQRSTQEARPLPLQIHSQNEVGKLAKSFNRLFEVLEASRHELAENEENLRITLDSIGDSVITTDIQGHITGMNPAAEALLEQSLTQTKGGLLSEVLPLFNSKTKKQIPNIIEEVLSSGITLNLPPRASLVLPNNKEKFIADSAAPIRNPEGNITGCVLVLRDITEKHQLESQLAQSQKMDALGQMAGGIAHDFNNMLTPILGAAQLLKEAQVSDENRQKFASMISTAGERAAGLTQQMLTFSRKAPSSKEVIDLRDVIEESRAMLQHAIGSNISIQTQRPLHPMMTLGDTAQIQNIFFNMALNARDAMPKSGTLSFHIKRTHVDAEYCRLHAHEIAPGAYIEVQIADTGEGIDPDDLPDIFNPFFTTKPAGKGTGLGLASVYGVMKKHKGMVSVSSKKDKGTTFQLYFPEVIAAEPAKVDPLPTKQEGALKVLLIDDDKTVLKVTTALLNNLGYEVLCAGGGTEGVDLYKTHQKEISLIMLDLVMPKMNGEETFEKLREINPGVAVLIISGFDAEESVTRLLQGGAADFLHKPFQLHSLAKALQRTLL